MPQAFITRFDPDPTLLEPLLEAARYSPFNADTAWSPDWPGNILSKRIVISGDGTIARRDEPVRFAVDPAELTLCRRLAAEAEVLSRASGSPVARPTTSSARSTTIARRL
jgi:hypothetical protein